MVKKKGLSSCVCAQPKVTDEDGWKRFCLGDVINQSTSSYHTDTETDPAIDYNKVLRVFVF